MLVLTFAVSALLIAATGAPNFLPTGAEETGPQEVELGRDRAQRMTVPVEVNGAGPFDFVIDTGAERTLVTHELARELGLESSTSAMVQTVAGLHILPLYSVEDLSVAGDGVIGLLAPGVARSGLGAAGLLGLDSLQNSRILIDMRAKKMSVLPSVAMDRRPSNRRGLITIVADELRGRMILTKARLNRVPVRVVVDTGAQVTIGNEALRRALVRRAETEGVELYDVLGESLAGEYHRIRDLKIDRATMSGGAIVYSDAPVFRELGLSEEPAILLGMSMLKAFDTVEIDFPNRLVAFDLPASASAVTGIRTNCGGTLIRDGGRC